MGCSMGVSKVRKRDGSIVRFSPHRVSSAIEKSMLAVGIEDENLPRDLAEKVIDYAKGTFEEQLKEKKFDCVIDCIGGKETEKQAIKILKKNGKFVTLCGPEKYIGETRNGKWGLVKMFSYISLRAFMSMFIGPRYIMAGISSSPAPIQNLILKNDIKPVIDRNLSFDEKSVRDGVAYVASHRARGKVVISVIE